nr:MULTISPECIES: polysaccharide deacetylase family protein [unclassified Leucobacter]
MQLTHSQLNRRTVLSLLTVAGAGVLAACGSVPEPVPVQERPVVPKPPVPVPAPAPTPAPTPTPPPAPLVAKVPLPGGPIFDIPGEGSLLAWTVDDGSNAEVIARYARFAAESGTRLTFFLNGSYPGWSENAALLAPLVASGQVQLANHTWSHAGLTSLSDAQIVQELQQNHDFIQATYGVDARPFYRPPYGYRDERTDAAAASIGYTSPIMWYGSLADSGLISPEQLLGFANEWFLPQHIVIGHLNFTPVTEVFPQLSALIAERGLTTVTLNDIFEY